MATVSKNYRMDVWTAGEINRLSSELGISQANVIRIAIEAFTSYGIDRILTSQDYKGNDANAYSTLIAMSMRGQTIEHEIKNQIQTCARF